MPLFKALPTGTIVGDTDAQTLTNKTLTAPALGAATATSINFGGTSLANYVEGTWTPAITTDATAGTPAYTIQVGSYERIGRQITCRFTISLSGWTGSPTGNVLISGLPLASANTTNDRGTGCISSWSTASNVAFLGADILPNTSAVRIVYTATPGTATGNLTAAQAGVTFIVAGIIHYRV